MICIYKHTHLTKIVSVILYGYELWPLKLGDEHESQISQMTEQFWTLHSKELDDLTSLSNLIRVMKSKRDQMGETRIQDTEFWSGNLLKSGHLGD